MSLSTPILTTSPEISAEAEPLRTSKAATAIANAAVELQHTAEKKFKLLSELTPEELAAEVRHFAEIEEQSERELKILRTFQSTFALVGSCQLLARDFLQLALQLDRAAAQLRAIQGMTFNCVKKTGGGGGQSPN